MNLKRENCAVCKWYLNIGENRLRGDPALGVWLRGDGSDEGRGALLVLPFTGAQRLPVQSGVDLSAASHCGSFAEKSFWSQERWSKRVRTPGHLPEEGLCAFQGPLVSTEEKTGIAPISQGLLLLRIIRRKENEDAKEGTKWSVSLSCVSWRSVGWGVLRRHWRPWGVGMPSPHSEVAKQ